MTSKIRGRNVIAGTALAAVVIVAGGTVAQVTSGGPWGGGGVGGGGGFSSALACLIAGGADCSMTGAVEIASGTVGAPGLAFDADADGTGTGLYRIGANNPGLAVNGVLAHSWSTTAITSALPNLVASGAVGAPGLAFSADADGTGTGLYRIGADNIGLAINGVLVESWSSTAITSAQSRLSNGVASDVTTAGSEDYTINPGGTGNAIVKHQDVASVYFYDDSGVAIGTETSNFASYDGGTTAISVSGDHAGLSIKGNGGRGGNLLITSDAVAADSAGIHVQWTGATNDKEAWVISAKAASLTIENRDEDDTAVNFIAWEVFDGKSMRGPTMVASSAPAQPHACDSAHAGAMVYVDDTDDTAISAVCICGTTAADVYDWLVIGTMLVACPFF